MPSPIARKKKANFRAAPSSMKWQIIDQAAAISAKAAATLARWKTTISGRLSSAAMWPRTIQNMKREAAGADSAAYRLCHGHAPPQPRRILAGDALASPPREEKP